MAKAILIDVAARAVREVECDTLHDGAQKLIGGYLQIGHAWANGDVLYVDEDGLSKPQAHFFRFGLRRDPQPLAGNGVILGREILDDERNWTGNHAPRITADEVAKLVQWLDRRQADAWAMGNASEPAMTFTSFGRGRVEHVVLRRTGSMFADMPKSGGEFSVFVFMPDDSHLPVVRFTDVETAMTMAQRAIASRIGPASHAERVIITDGGDFTVFEWKRDQGVTWPKPEGSR